MTMNAMLKPPNPSTNSADRIVDAHYVLSNEIIHLNVLLMNERRLKHRYLKELQFIHRYQLSVEDKLEIKCRRQEERDNDEDENPKLHPSHKQVISDLKAEAKMYKMESEELRISLTAANTVLKQQYLLPRKEDLERIKRRNTAPIQKRDHHHLKKKKKHKHKHKHQKERMKMPILQPMQVDINAVNNNNNNDKGDQTQLKPFRDEAEDKLLAKLDEEDRKSIECMDLHEQNEKLNQDLNTCLSDIEHEIATFDGFDQDLLSNKENKMKKRSTHKMDMDKMNRDEAISRLEAIVDANEKEKECVGLKIAKLSELIKQKTIEMNNEINALKAENETLKSKVTSMKKEQFSNRFCDIKRRRSTSKEKTSTNKMNMEKMNREEAISRLEAIFDANEKEKECVGLKIEKLSELNELIKQKTIGMNNEINALKAENETLKSKATSMKKEQFSNRFCDIKRRRSTSDKEKEEKNMIKNGKDQRMSMPNQDSEVKADTKLMRQLFDQAQIIINELKAENETLKSKATSIKKEQFSNRFCDIKRRRTTSYKQQKRESMIKKTKNQRMSMPNQDSEVKPDTKLLKQLFDQAQIDGLSAENAELKSGHEYNVIVGLRMRVHSLTQKLKKANGEIAENKHFYKVDFAQMDRLKKGFVALSRLVAKLRSVHVVFREDIEIKVDETQNIIVDGLREIRSKGMEFMSMFERGMSKELLRKTANEYGVCCVSKVEDVKEIIKNIRIIETRDKESVHWSRATKVANNLLFGHVNADYMNMSYDV